MLVGLLHIGQRQKSAQLIAQQLKDSGYASRDIDWVDFVHDRHVLKPLDYVVINLASADADIDEALDYLTDHEIPIVFNDAYLTNSLKTDAQQRWLRHLLNKISDANDLLPESLEEDLESLETPSLQDYGIDSLWVICAGLGGPPVVKSLLEQLHDSDSVRCIVMQQVEPEFLLLLEKQLNEQQTIEVTTLADGTQLDKKQAWIMPPASGLSMGPAKGLNLCELNYAEHRTFSRDLAAVCEQLQEMFGTIHLAVLTGMHKDCAQAVDVIVKNNGQVLVQSPDSCVLKPEVSDMQHLKDYELLDLPQMGQRIQATTA